MSAPTPSATVVALRRHEMRLEVLLLKRSHQLDIHGGAWVFPGGSIDPVDRREADDELNAARRAAVRELFEEAGLKLSPKDLVVFQRWTTPEGMPRRYHAWFFACEVAGGSVQVDNGEIVDFAWVTPQTALYRQRSGSLTLPPPTFVTLTRLSAFNDPAQCLDALQNAPVAVFDPKMVTTADGLCFLYQGDAGYGDGNAAAPEPHHRLWLRGPSWEYENHQ